MELILKYFNPIGNINIIETFKCFTLINQNTVCILHLQHVSVHTASLSARASTLHCADQGSQPHLWGSSHRQFVLTGPGLTVCTRTPHGTWFLPFQHNADSAGWTPSIPWTFLCLPWVPAWVPSVGGPPPHLLTCCVKARRAPSGLCPELPARSD